MLALDLFPIAAISVVGIVTLYFSYRRGRLSTRKWISNSLFVVLTVIVIFLADRFDQETLTDGVMALSLVAMAFVAASNIRKRKVLGGKLAGSTATLQKSKAPTVTYAVAARNEDESLRESLSNALQINYPKIDYLALDDCSFDQTPGVIRSFAHDGIRFVQSLKTAEDSLQHSLYALVDHALGEYVVFSGVDVRLDADALSKSITYMRQNDLRVLSVIPAKHPGDKKSLLFEPIRYWLQNISPSNSSYAHSFWIAELDLLKSGAGHVPEKKQVSYRLLSNKAGSDFALASAPTDLGIYARKKAWAQWRSTLRDASLVMDSEIGYAVGALMMTSWLAINSPLISLSVFTVWWGLCMYWSLWQRRSYSVVMLAFNCILQVLTLAPMIAASGVTREMGVLSWKGRNVCYPPRKDFKNLTQQ